MTWSTKDSSELYSVPLWSKGYFQVNDRGHMEVSLGENKTLDLRHLVEDLKERGISLPLLIRFSDLLEARIKLLNSCFQKAIDEQDYKGRYQCIYPIKVNQQAHLVDQIIDYGKPYHLGLECGSKPELLIALASIKDPLSPVICNGFKDSEYIETALLSQKMGQNTIIVVERMEELPIILDLSKKLDVSPKLGLRVKLETKAEGHWEESAGNQSKFGLTLTEILDCLKILKEANCLTGLKLLHFHVGSQIPSIQAIKSSLKEGVRVYVELKKLAPSLSYLDVGGGLGVDYDGSGATNSSTNYTEQEYANDVIAITQSICSEQDLDVPCIITESGRSLVAHSSVLVFDVLGKASQTKKPVNFEVSSKDSRLVLEMMEIYQSISDKNINESYNDIIEKRKDSLQMFTYGVLSLEDRSKTEILYWESIKKISNLLEKMENVDELLYEVQTQLSDIYFCNFSIFQSLPDAWALKQVFPIMPIQNLDKKPEKRAILVDLTCDSDGKLSNFIDSTESGHQNYLEVHDFKDSPYYIGVFLTGAYQEILGDLHNLFGDTNIAHITSYQDSYIIEHMVRSDSIEDVLNYVEYNKHDLLENLRKSLEESIKNSVISKREARLLLEKYEKSFSKSTYFTKEESFDNPMITSSSKEPSL